LPRRPSVLVGNLCRFGPPGPERVPGRPRRPCGRASPGGEGSCPPGVSRPRESREKGVAPICFSAPGLPFVGFPVFRLSPRTTSALRPLSRGRHSPLWCSSLRLACPFRASNREPTVGRVSYGPLSRLAPPLFRPADSVTVPLSRQASAVADNPPGLPFPSALPEPGIRFTRALRARHAPAAAFLTLSPGFAPRNLSGLISSR
jgi:hypothetical protein